MGWFSFLTSTPKIVDNVFDKDKGLLTQIGGWVGNQQFTEQERAEMDVGMVKAVQGFAVATLAENTDRSKTRRKIAIGWFEMQIWLIKLNVLCVFIDKFGSLFDRDFNLTAEVSTIAFSGLLWGVTSGIGLFFWGTHGLRSSKLGKD